MVLLRAAADHLSTKLIALTAVLMGQLLIMLIIIGAPLLRPLNGKEIADSQTRLRARSSKPCVFFFSLSQSAAREIERDASRHRD
jgi:hypothetical protein